MPLRPANHGDLKFVTDLLRRGIHDGHFTDPFMPLHKLAFLAIQKRPIDVVNDNKPHPATTWIWEDVGRDDKGRDVSKPVGLAILLTVASGIDIWAFGILTTEQLKGHGRAFLEALLEGPLVKAPLIGANCFPASTGMAILLPKVGFALTEEKSDHLRFERDPASPAVPATAAPVAYDELGEPLSPDRPHRPNERAAQMGVPSEQNHRLARTTLDALAAFHAAGNLPERTMPGSKKPLYVTSAPYEERLFVDALDQQRELLAAEAARLEAEAEAEAARVAGARGIISNIASKVGQIFKEPEPAEEDEAPLPASPPPPQFTRSNPPPPQPVPPTAAQEGPPPPPRTGFREIGSLRTVLDLDRLYLGGLSIRELVETVMQIREFTLDLAETVVDLEDELDALREAGGFAPEPEPEPPPQPTLPPPPKMMVPRRR